MLRTGILGVFFFFFVAELNFQSVTAYIEGPMCLHVAMMFLIFTWNILLCCVYYKVVVTHHPHNCYYIFLDKLHGYIF